MLLSLLWRLRHQLSLLLPVLQNFRLILSKSRGPASAGPGFCRFFGPGFQIIFDSQGIIAVQREINKTE